MLYVDKQIIQFKKIIISRMTKGYLYTERNFEVKIRNIRDKITSFNCNG